MTLDVNHPFLGYPDARPPQNPTLAGWRVAYTPHPKRFDAPSAPVLERDLKDLIQAESGPMKAALLTSYDPFEIGFLDRFPQGWLMFR